MMPKIDSTNILLACKDLKMVDDRILEPSVPILLHRIRDRIRECEKYNIDYESYVDKRDLEIMIDTLDCCISHKDSKHIIRRE